MTNSNGKPVRRDQSGHAWRKARARAIRNSNGSCAICHNPIDHDLTWPEPGSASVDHIVPVSRGGALTAAGNLRVVHLICNQQRGNGDTGPHGSPCALLNHVSRDWIGQGLAKCPEHAGFHAAW